MSPSPALSQVLAVLLEAADAVVLRRVLGLLLEVSQAAMLRKVINQLLDAPATPPAARVAPPPSRVVRGTAAPPPVNPRWAELRPRLRACLARGVSEPKLAAACGIAPSTLHRALTGVRRGPSAAIIARATAWLAAHAAGNESADRLSVEQRERLAFLAAHESPEIRREVHVTRAQLEQAVAGEILEPEILGRLTVLLSGERPAERADERGSPAAPGGSASGG
jgi:hypothetical protein